MCQVAWPRLPSLDTVPGSQVTLLMVADPQIVGNIHEPGGVLGWVQRWDCDRYLAKSYAWALSSYTGISTVIFMGDLIDEGSEADDQKFADYADRFHGVYPMREGVNMVYIPGDNDIGGEGVDPVTINKMDRYPLTLNKTRIGPHAFKLCFLLYLGMCKFNNSNIHFQV